MSVAELAQMTGIKENDLQQWLAMMAAEMKDGCTIEQAAERINARLNRLHSEMEKKEEDQAEWFRAWKASMAADVYYTILSREAQRRIFA